VNTYVPEPGASPSDLEPRIDTHTPVRAGALALLVVVGSALIIWEAAVRVSGIPPYLLPAPSEVAISLATRAPHYAGAALATLLEALAGLALGVCAGIAIAVTVTFHAKLERGILALAILIKATPIVAVVPLLTIWFGFGPVPKIAVTALMTFFPVLVNVHAGLNAVDQAVLALFHSLNASRRELLWHAQWPNALPYLFAALKVVGPLSLVGAVVAEWAGASSGLGRAMWLAYTSLDMPSLFAAVFCSALMGIGLHGLISALEERIVFWT
jgi:ABC-type nitrate/sulfonate/bicarbonate transport system permease component